MPIGPEPTVRFQIQIADLKGIGCHGCYPRFESLIIEFDSIENVRQITPLPQVAETMASLTGAGGRREMEK
jgi:hypothetical protein